LKHYKIDVSEAVRYHGETYYLRIRSNDESNPVVLFLHGGPGSPDMPFVMKYQSALADACTIVAWDQRGCGRAYDRKLAKTEVLTKELYISDAHNVILYLKERFGKEKIVIVGHSFGSQLGVWVAQRFPEDIAAYAGIGQVVDLVRNEDLSFAFVMDEAVKRKDARAIKRLRAIGPPVNGFYKDDKVFVQRNYLHKYGGAQYGKHRSMIGNALPLIPCMFGEYPLKTMLNFFKGNFHCLGSPMCKERLNFLEEAKELQMPVFLFIGRHDYNTPFALAEDWFHALRAPYKQLVWFEKSGHEPQWEEPERWNEVFRKYVLGG
jgi:pimeloyl-ACP methyl ester carboxylesterase